MTLACTTDCHNAHGKTLISMSFYCNTSPSPHSTKPYLYRGRTDMCLWSRSNSLLNIFSTRIPGKCTCRVEGPIPCHEKCTCSCSIGLCKGTGSCPCHSIVQPSSVFLEFDSYTSMLRPPPQLWLRTQPHFDCGHFVSSLPSHLLTSSGWMWPCSHGK